MSRLLAAPSKGPYNPFFLASQTPVGGFFLPRFGSAIFFPRFGSTPPSRFLATVIIFGLLDTKSVNCHRDRGVTVAILVTVDVFRLSDDVLNSKMSTVTGIAEGRVAILVTVDVFGLSHLLGDSKVSTVTGIAGGHGRHPRNCRRISTLG